MRSVKRSLLKLVNYAKLSLEKSIEGDEKPEKVSEKIEEIKGIEQKRNSEDSGSLIQNAGKIIGSSEYKKEIELEQSIKNEETDNIQENTSVNSNVDNIGIKYMFPPLSRLQKTKLANIDTEQLKETAIYLQSFLKNYGVMVNIKDIAVSANFTRFEIELLQGMQVKRILKLSDDIKMNLGAIDVQIIPIPEKGTIGIDVLNRERIIIPLGEMLESREFLDNSSSIPLVAGRDIYNNTVITDIAHTSNIIISGTTGSGKSMFINSIIISILYKAHPDDVKMVMIDTKAINLSGYNGIPHLLIPVVTDMQKALMALHWVQSEMNDRHRKFTSYSVRSLKEYNNHSDIEHRLPQILVIIDDLSDLMALHKKDAEQIIAEITRLSRGTGIYLILATQRPSADVFTGLIKSNISSRVAFKVFSAMDSRVILDEKGAEELLGNGDMLFKPQGYIKPVRIQAPFISDEEISDVIDFLRNQMVCNVYTKDNENKIINVGFSGNENSIVKLDELFEKAGRFIIEKDKASIGMLQRVLKVGFNRAARIMGQLCEYGVVSEDEGTKPRKILMSIEQFEKMMGEL